MNSNTIRDIRQHLAGGTDREMFYYDTERVIRKIATRALLEQAVYISGASEYVCKFYSDTLRADDYDLAFLGDGAQMFVSRKGYEDAKQREYYGDFEKTPYFFVVDGKILGPVCSDRKEEQHSIEEALSLIFPELPTKVIVYTRSPKSDGFFLDLTETCEELSEKLADEAHERFGVDSDSYKDSCLKCARRIKQWMYYYEDLRKRGKFSVGPHFFPNADKQVFYWEVVE